MMRIYILNVVCNIQQATSHAHRLFSIYCVFLNKMFKLRNKKTTWYLRVEMSVATIHRHALTVNRCQKRFGRMTFVTCCFHFLIEKYFLYCHKLIYDFRCFVENYYYIIYWCMSRSWVCCIYLYNIPVI